MPAQSRHRRSYYHLTLQTAITLAVFNADIAVAQNANLPTSQADALHSYRLQPGPLGITLSRFALQAGMPLSFNPALTEGKYSAGLIGRYTEKQALERLLTGTGLEIVRNPDRSFGLRRLPLSQTSETQGENVVTLASINAYAQQEETAFDPVVGYIAHRSATATRTDTPLKEIPQSVTVIGTQQLQDQGSQTVQDALRYTAGLQSEKYGFDSRRDWFALRGMSESERIEDGLRIAQNEGYGLVRDEPFAYERIEVLRGPASLLAGENPPGGLVNFVNKRPQATPSREIMMQLGDNDKKRLGLDVTGPLDTQNKWLYRIVAVGNDSHTQVDHTKEKRFYIRPSITWQPTADTTLMLYAEYQRDKNNNLVGFYPVDGALYDRPGGKISPDTFVGEPGWDRNNGIRQRVGWEFKHRFNANWEIRHHFRYQHTDNLYNQIYADYGTGYVDLNGEPDATSPYLARVWALNRGKNNVINADIQLEGKFETGPIKHDLLIAFDGMKQHGHKEIGSGVTTPLNVYNPEYGNFSSLGFDPYYFSDTRTNSWGATLQNQMKFFDNVILSAGLRYDRVNNRQNNRIFANTIENDQSDKAVSKNVGLLWLAPGGFSPYISYSESFQPVLYAAKADGSKAKPQRGQQIEGGLKWESADSRFTAQAAIFRIKERNRSTTDGANPGFIAQQGEVTSQGFELEGAARLENWDLIAQYTRTNAKITKTDEDNARLLGEQLEGIPEHAASIWAVHKFGYIGLPGLKAGAGIRYRGEIGDNLKDGVRVSSMTLLDAMVAYETKTWRMQLNINNLTDKKYVSICSQWGDCYFGNRRKVLATVSYKF